MSEEPKPIYLVNMQGNIHVSKESGGWGVLEIRVTGRNTEELDKRLQEIKRYASQSFDKYMHHFFQDVKEAAVRIEVETKAKVVRK